MCFLTFLQLQCALQVLISCDLFSIQRQVQGEGAHSAQEGWENAEEGDGGAAHLLTMKGQIGRGEGREGGWGEERGGGGGGGVVYNFHRCENFVFSFFFRGERKN